jgi:hypothetical protein
MSAEKRKIIPGLLVLSVLAALALVSANTWNVASAVEERNSSGTKTSKQFPAASINKAVQSVAAQSEIVNAQPASDDERIEVEVITVRANGFEPRAITRPDGQFILALTNHTEVDELALRLDRVRGDRLQEVRMRRGRIRWNQVFNLPSGDYLLSEQNHPDWACRITLTAR